MSKSSTKRGGAAKKSGRTRAIKPSTSKSGGDLPMSAKLANAEREEAERVTREVSKTLAFLRSDAPQFLRQSAIAAINRACVAQEVPLELASDNPDNRQGVSDAEIKKQLATLFRRTGSTLTEFDLVGELRREGAEEEARKPYESIDNWDGSETFQLLSEVELEYAGTTLGEDSRGAYFTGLNILVLQHLGKLAFQKRFNDLERAISRIGENMVAADRYAQKKGSDLLPDTRESQEESVTWNLSNDAANSSTKLRKHIEGVESRKREAKAA